MEKQFAKQLLGQMLMHALSKKSAGPTVADWYEEQPYVKIDPEKAHIRIEATADPDDPAKLLHRPVIVFGEHEVGSATTYNTVLKARQSCVVMPCVPIKTDSGKFIYPYFNQHKADAALRQMTRAEKLAANIAKSKAGYYANNR